MSRGTDDRQRGFIRIASTRRTYPSPGSASGRLRGASLIDQYRFLERQNEALQLAVSRLTQLVYVDGLTGLANRRYLDLALDSEMRRSSRSGAPVTLALCDIDHFKRFNDMFGHQCGDAVLEKVAEIICRQCRRTGDVAARYGGEEFALLLPGVGSSETVAIAELLRRGVADLSIRRGSEELERVTISIGITTWRPGERCAGASVIRAADTALYRAKQAGRNRTKYEPIRPHAGRREGPG